MTENLTEFWLAIVPKVAIFAVLTDHSENEVALDPRRPRKITHEPVHVDFTQDKAA
jgi:hypothetical protein